MEEFKFVWRTQIGDYNPFTGNIVAEEDIPEDYILQDLNKGFAADGSPILADSVAIRENVLYYQKQNFPFELVPMLQMHEDKVKIIEQRYEELLQEKLSAITGAQALNPADPELVAALQVEYNSLLDSMQADFAGITSRSARLLSTERLSAPVYRCKWDGFLYEQHPTIPDILKCPRCGWEIQKPEDWQPVEESAE